MALPRAVTLRSKRKDRESESIIRTVYSNHIAASQLLYCKGCKPRCHSYAAALLSRRYR